MGKVANPVRITEEGLLVVRSIKPYEECVRYRRSYEWVITLRLYCSDRPETQKFFGLSDSDYLYWLKLLAKKSSQNRKKAQNEKENNKEKFNII